MAVYVDRIQTAVKVSTEAARYGKEWCHMIADAIEELHEMALAIGLKREYFQDKLLPHYDLTPSRRKLAIEKGAIELDNKDFVSRVQEARKKRREEKCVDAI